MFSLWSYICSNLYVSLVSNKMRTKKNSKEINKYELLPHFAMEFCMVQFLNLFAIYHNAVLCVFLANKSSLVSLITKFLFSYVIMTWPNCVGLLKQQFQPFTFNEIVLHVSSHSIIHINNSSNTSWHEFCAEFQICFPKLMQLIHIYIKMYICICIQYMHRIAPMPVWMR